MRTLGAAIPRGSSVCRVVERQSHGTGNRWVRRVGLSSEGVYFFGAIKQGLELRVYEGEEEVEGCGERKVWKLSLGERESESTSTSLQRGCFVAWAEGGGR